MHLPRPEQGCRLPILGRSSVHKVPRSSQQPEHRDWKPNKACGCQDGSYTSYSPLLQVRPPGALSGLRQHTALPYLMASRSLVPVPCSSCPKPHETLWQAVPSHSSLHRSASAWNAFPLPHLHNSLTHSFPFGSIQDPTNGPPSPRCLP